MKANTLVFRTQILIMKRQNAVIRRIKEDFSAINEEFIFEAISNGGGVNAGAK
jgi:uncharacterized protein (DUF433 family)